MRLNIRAKILLSNIAILLLLVVTAVFSMQRLALVAQASTEIAHDWLPSVEVVSDMLSHVDTAQAHTFAHIASPDEEQMVALEAESRANWSEFTRLALSYTPHEQEKELLQQLLTAATEYEEMQGRIFRLSRAHEDQRAGEMAWNEGRALFLRMEALASRLVKVNTEGAAEASRRSDDLYVQTGIYLALVAGGAVLLGLVLSIFISRRMTAGIRAVAGTAAQVAAGNLAVEPVQVTSADEVGDLARAFNTMTTSLRAVLQAASRSSEAVASSAHQLTSSTDQMLHVSEGVALSVGQVAQGASAQATVVRESSRGVEELRSSIAQIASGAQAQAAGAQAMSHTVGVVATAIDDVVRKAASVAESARKAAETARTGGAVVDETIHGMGQIQAQVGHTAEQIRQLNQLSGQIGAITEVITGIAEQTNLLALNAAIEAARAGDHGRGFAVVADEVRRLAEHAGKSAREIQQLIEAMQRGTALAVEAIDLGTAEVARGTELSAQAVTALHSILEMTEQTARDAGAITTAALQIDQANETVVKAAESTASVTEENTAATEEMAAGADQVMASVGQIATISQENAAAAEEVSAAVEEMNAGIEEIASSARELTRVAQELQGQIARFRL